MIETIALILLFIGLVGLFIIKENKINKILDDNKFLIETIKELEDKIDFEADYYEKEIEEIEKEKEYLEKRFLNAFEKNNKLVKFIQEKAEEEEENKQNYNSQLEEVSNISVKAIEERDELLKENEELKGMLNIEEYKQELGKELKSKIKNKK